MHSLWEGGTKLQAKTLKHSSMFLGNEVSEPPWTNYSCWLALHRSLLCSYINERAQRTHEFVFNRASKSIWKGEHAMTPTVNSQCQSPSFQGMFWAPQKWLALCDIHIKMCSTRPVHDARVHVKTKKRPYISCHT